MGSGYTVIMNGLPLISTSFNLRCNLCWPRLMAVYDTSYREGEVAATAACTVAGFSDRLMGVVLEMSSNSAVIFCRTEHGLLLGSVNSSMMYVGWLEVDDSRPGPLIEQV